MTQHQSINHYIPQNYAPIEHEFVEPIPDDYFIWWLFRYRCVECKKTATEINEILPRARTKTAIHLWRNRVTMCRECHTKYHSGGVTDKKMKELREIRKNYLLSIDRSQYA